MAVVIELRDFEYFGDFDFVNTPAMKFMARLSEVNGILLGITPYPYRSNDKPSNTYTFVAFGGLTIKIETHCHNSSDDYREWQVATVAVPQADGSYKYETYNADYTYEGHRSMVDATPEVVAAYEAHLAYIARKEKVQRKLSDRKSDMQLAKIMGLKDRFAVTKLQYAVGNDVFSACITLLKTHKKGTLRSDFRKSIATQIVAWVNEPVNKYRSPLSPKQREALLNNASYGNRRYY